MNAVRNRRPVEHPLHRELCLAIAVGRVRRAGLQNRHTLRLAVGRGGRGKDNVLDAVLDHALQHCPRAAEVVVVVFEGIHHALANLRVCREVNHRVDLFAGKDMIAKFFIADVSLIEPRFRMHRSPEASLQIIGYAHIMAVVNQFIYRVAADVACTAEYQNCFHLRSFPASSCYFSWVLTYSVPAQQNLFRHLTC